MPVKETVFKYTTEGAKAAQRADKGVRDSVRETGRTANQQAGRVERWMTANKRAIQGLAIAATGAMGAILSASPTMRAELSGVRTAFSLFADQIVNDLLPGTGSLAGTALNLAQNFRSLDSDTRTLIGGFGLFLGVLGTVAATVGSVAAAVVAGITAQAAIIGTFLKRVGALNNVLNAWMNIGKAVVSLLTGDFGQAWKHAKQAIGQFLAAAGEIVGSAVSFGADLISGIITGIGNKLSALRERAGEVATAIRDNAVDFATDALQWGRDVVADIVNGIGQRVEAIRMKAEQIATTIADNIIDFGTSAFEMGRSVVNGIIDGLKSRMKAIKNAAKEVAQAIRDRLPSSPAKKGPLSDLDKVGPGAAETVASGLESNTGRVAGAANSFAGGMGGMGGGGQGQVNVVFEKGAVQIRGTGSSKRDGQKVGEEASDYIGRSLGSRGME